MVTDSVVDKLGSSKRPRGKPLSIAASQSDELFSFLINFDFLRPNAIIVECGEPLFRLKKVWRAFLCDSLNKIDDHFFGAVSFHEGNGS